MGRSRLKILVLSFYFPPDLSACSFRTAALIRALRVAVPVDSQIEVVTTLPNRYSTFSIDAPEFQYDAGVTVCRIPLPQHKSGLVDQSRAFFAFSRGVDAFASEREYDLVFATSSRLMTAVLGARVARRKHSLLYLDIRDIFADTIGDVLPRPLSLFAKRFFSRVEKWAVQRSDRVNLVSEGFADYFDRRYPRQRFSYFTNGIDEEFLAGTVLSKRSTPPESDRGITVLYAGNIGEGQGLHAIIPGLARAMGDGVRFSIIGDGGRKSELASAVDAAGIGNVQLLDPLPRAELLRTYHAADVLFVHLNDHAAFEKVLPSKLFEYGALGKPVWAGVSGYAADFVRSEISNSAVFAPCDVDSAVNAFGELAIGDTPRPDFCAKYSRTQISAEMAKDIVSLFTGQ